MGTYSDPIREASARAVDQSRGNYGWNDDKFGGRMDNDSNGMSQSQYDNARALLNDKDFETWLNGGVEVKRSVAEPNRPDPVRPPVQVLTPGTTPPPNLIDPGKLVDTPKPTEPGNPLDPVKEATPRRVLSALTINSPMADNRPNTTKSTTSRSSEASPRDPDKSVCKPRPDDNTPKGGGGGGSKREFIPWCDRKR